MCLSYMVYLSDFVLIGIRVFELVSFICIFVFSDDLENVKGHKVALKVGVLFSV